MSAPMDVSMSKSTSDAVISEENGGNPKPQPSASSPILAGDKVIVSVEVCLKSSSAARIEDARSAVESSREGDFVIKLNSACIPSTNGRMLENRNMSYADGPIPVPFDDQFLLENVQRICVCDTDEWAGKHDVLLFWQVKPIVHVFQLSEEGPCEDLTSDGQLSSFNEWILPAKEFDGMWESLIYESGLKKRLLHYAASALLFTERGVNPFLVSWNRIILLHGPPGTGKTSLCKALAQKLSIRFSNRYSQCQLIEVNAHSLFSKWFSESGKLVAKLFSKIQEMVEEENSLIFVLIDEVESLAAARKAALSGSEPSDSIRVVNALLTQLDKLKSAPNVIILTTSNITAAIDVAFVDRADIKAYVGPPTLEARYEILRSCLQELLRTGILSDSQLQDEHNLTLPNFAGLKEKLNGIALPESQGLVCLCKQLLEVAEACEGMSGRSLRKLPFIAHASLAHPYSCAPGPFLESMVETARRERSEMPD